MLISVISNGIMGVLYHVRLYRNELTKIIQILLYVEELCMTTTSELCSNFENEVSLMMHALHREFGHSPAQNQLSQLGTKALGEIHTYLISRRPHSQFWIEERMQKGWCMLLEKIREESGLPQPEHRSDSFNDWMRWLEIQ